MATRSTIAIEKSDGTIEQIYCHWDGYPEYNGKILLQSYSNPMKLQELIDMGNMSSLDSTIDACEFWVRDQNDSMETAKPRRYSSYWDYVTNLSREQFNYILRESGEWMVGVEQEDSEFKGLCRFISQPLSSALNNIAA
jgi:hypothetical protein